MRAELLVTGFLGLLKIMRICPKSGVFDWLRHPETEAESLPNVAWTQTHIQRFSGIVIVATFGSQLGGRGGRSPSGGNRPLEYMHAGTVSVLLLV